MVSINFFYSKYVKFWYVFENLEGVTPSHWESGAIHDLPNLKSNISFKSFMDIYQNISSLVSMFLRVFISQKLEFCFSICDVAFPPNLSRTDCLFKYVVFHSYLKTPFCRMFK